MTNSVSRLSALMPAFLLLVLVLLLPIQSQAANEGDVISIRNDAPELYVVVRGDTLWDISAKFLQEPWLWPQIWELNPQIEDPHWIYPGDVIGLSYVNGIPRLTLNRIGRPSDLNAIKLSPQVRREAIRSAIPAIALEDINSFLSGNSVVSVEQLENAPYILDGRDFGMFSSNGEVVFARGNWEGVGTYEVVREGRTYFDPQTGRAIGVEAILVATASMLTQEGERGTLVIEESYMEARTGDKFLPRSAQVIDSTYFPEPPSFEVDANVVAIQSRRTVGGNRDSLVLNVGEQDNIDVGHLLTVQKEDYDVVDETVGRLIASKDRVVTFTGEKFARVMVYRVFEGSSLALVLNTDGVIRVNDRVVTP